MWWRWGQGPFHVLCSSAEEGRQNLDPVFSPAQQGFFTEAVASKQGKGCDAMVNLSSQGWFPLAAQAARQQYLSLPRSPNPDLGCCCSGAGASCGHEAARWTCQSAVSSPTPRKWPGQLVTDTRKRSGQVPPAPPRPSRSASGARMPQDVQSVRLLWRILNRRTKQLPRPIFHFRTLKGFKT